MKFWVKQQILQNGYRGFLCKAAANILSNSYKELKFYIHDVECFFYMQ